MCPEGAMLFGTTSPLRGTSTPGRGSYPGAFAPGYTTPPRRGEERLDGRSGPPPHRGDGCVRGRRGIGLALMSTEEIQSAVSQLSTEELARFSDWFEEFMADQWDRRIEADILAGRL